jgi:succinate-semialdehyde dehydrogenase/glutarate-semialdehyde dehydrogenase
MTKSFTTINPTTGQELRTYHYLSSSEIEKELQETYEYWHEFKRLRLSTRAELLLRIAQGLRAHEEEFARLMAEEMGKPLADGMAEVEKCAVTCEYFATHAEEFMATHSVNANYPQAKIVKESLGPILAIMPWNFPLWQVIRFAAPAVIIGNPILLKHAEITAGCAELIEKIFWESSGEEALLLNLPMTHEQAAQVIADPRVRGVTFTGSARGGKQVATVAGASLKKTVLELGGSDPYVVLADAKVSAAAEICALARATNNGQSCVAAKRFLVHESVLEEFIHHFQTTFENLAVGDPLQKRTRLGPLAQKRFQKQLLEQCQTFLEGREKKLFDLGRDSDLSDPGAFFRARAYLMRDENPVFESEELFGPVALIRSFSEESQAIALANKSIYGLGGAVFSEDTERAERVARQIETGFVAINDQVKSDARLPFGGVKNSGYGRELSQIGFHEFVSFKSLGIAPSANSPRVTVSRSPTE